MARGWTCPRCSNKNGEGTLNCAQCGLIRGGVVVQPSPAASGDGAAHSPVAEPTNVAGVPLHTWGDSQAQAAWVVAEPAPKGPVWRRIPVRAWVFAALVIVSGISVFVTSAIRLPLGDIAKSGDLTSSDLNIGDCWDLKDRLAATFDTVTGRPCSEEHEFEVFHAALMPDGDYPAEQAFVDFVGSECISPFGEYVGRAYRDSELDIMWIVPTTQSWNQGDRSVLCSVEDPSNWRLIGSARASKR